MKKFFKLLIVTAVAISMLFAMSSAAMAKDSGNIQMMESSGINFIQSNATTSSITLTWNPDAAADSGITINYWYISNGIDEDSITLTDALTPDTDTYTLKNQNRAVMGHLYLCANLTEDGTTKDLWVDDVYASTTYARYDFGMQGSGTSYKFVVTNNDSVAGNQIEVRTATGSLVKRFDTNGSTKFSFSKDKAYKYRVRPYLKDEDGNIHYGAFSAYNYFDNPSGTIHHNTAISGFTIKLKGVKNVKYKIYVSTSSKNRGKLTATYKPSVGKSKTYKLNKIGSSTLKAKTKYYVTIVPVINGYESDVTGSASFTNKSN